MARYIPLGSRTRAHHNKFAIVDDEDFEWLSIYNWSYSAKGYVHRRTRKNKMVYMHRQVMYALSGQMIDHINGEKWDNRKSNLRFCTHRENMRNKRKTSIEKTSIYKGVSWDKYAQKWSASIRVDGKNVHLGNHKEAAEAARQYDAAAKTHFGEFANTNF